MKDRINRLLDENILYEINNKLAKPDKTIREHTEDLLGELDILKEYGYIKDEKIYSLVEKACIYHDIGKINREFQERINKSKVKKVKFDENKEIAHNILSIYFIDDKNFDSKEDYLRVMHSVLNHHNYCNTIEVMSNKKELIDSLLKDYDVFKIKKSMKNKLSGVIDDNESIKIKGYLHKCDYNASAGTISEYKNDFLEKSMENLMEEWKKEDSNNDWNELQRFCIENRDKNIIAVAQTGMGKTEAGLLWIGDTKGFFILPLRTAINAIYDRIRKNIIHEENLEERLSILHSSSLEYYLNVLSNEKNIADKEEIDLLNYQKTGKNLSIPLNISTMDQIFDFVYKYQGYELKLTTLSYSKIVIDEIQMYSPDLLAYLICGIEKIVELGGKVAILTATLPPFVQDLLEKNINFKYNPNGFTNNLKRHNLKIIDEKINSEDIYKKFIENKNLNRNNKILVVCNTIREAQNIYNNLKEKLSSDELKILHSRFIRKERLIKEEEILEFGKTYNENKEIDKQNGIWISTSIVEASLDIDFDYLFTELQDLNSLFQRLGRCNRKGKKDCRNYNCFIYTKIDDSILINGNKGFIDKKLYEISRNAILSCDGEITEKEKIELINEYLTTENLRNSDYMKKYREIYEFIKDVKPYKFDKNEIDLRNILSKEIIPSPIYEKYLGEIQEIESEIKEIECKLKYEEKDNRERYKLKKRKIKLKDELKKYTVSISLFDFNIYTNAAQKGFTNIYNKVRASEYEYINVIDCIYDETGYSRKDYKENKSNPSDYIL